jgi:hypothetical protein
MPEWHPPTEAKVVGEWTPPSEAKIVGEWKPPPEAKVVGAGVPAETPLSVGGTAAAFGRGAAPYALAAGAGAMAGGPIGAGAAVAATGLVQLGTDIYNWLTGGTSAPHLMSPQEATDKAFDALGVQRPGNWLERGAMASGSLAAGMAGNIPTARPAKPPGQPQQLLADFERQGVSPSIPTIGQGDKAAMAQNAGKRLPIVGGAIHNNVTRQLGETRDAAGVRAAEFGVPGDQFATGAVLRNSLKRFGADTSQADRDYAAFYKAMAGAKPVKMTGTIKLLDELMGRFPNAPELTGLFTPSPIAKAHDALSPRTVNIPAKTSSVLDSSGNPIITSPAQTVQRGGVLTIPELQEMRSKVGMQLENPTFGPDHVPRAQLKRLYAALTRDMHAAAQQQGPDAVKALAHATTNYGIRMKLIDRLEPLVSGDRPELAFGRLNNAAMAQGSADAGLLQAAKKVMTPEEWGDFGATIVARLGKPKPGASDILKEANFSMSSYMTNWAKLSDRAKDLIFGPNVPGSSRDALESLARVVQAQKNVEKLANTSRTAEYHFSGALALAGLHGAWEALSRGSFGELAGFAGAAGAGYVAGKVLTSPQFARWWYSVPKNSVVTPELAAKSTISLLNALNAPPAAAEQSASPRPPVR